MTPADLDHFRRRVLLDAMREATARYWERRAERLEWARPRPGDHHGDATREELRARWQRLTEQARACRQRAWIARHGGDLRTDLEVLDVDLEEAA